MLKTPTTSTANSRLSLSSILNDAQTNETYNLSWNQNPFDIFSQENIKAMPSITLPHFTQVAEPKSNTTTPSPTNNNNSFVPSFYQAPTYIPTTAALPASKPETSSMTMDDDDQFEQFDFGKESKQAKSKRKGWSKDEHIRFLIGLYLFGRGNWKTISKIIDGKSPKQVQSHAQKYFLRQQQHIRTKRSIHDFCFIDLMAMLRDKSYRESLSKSDAELDKLVKQFETKAQKNQHNELHLRALLIADGSFDPILSQIAAQQQQKQELEAAAKQLQQQPTVSASTPVAATPVMAPVVATPKPTIAAPVINNTAAINNFVQHLSPVQQQQQVINKPVSTYGTSIAPPSIRITTQQHPAAALFRPIQQQASGPPYMQQQQQHSRDCNSPQCPCQTDPTYENPRKKPTFKLPNQLQQQQQPRESQ